VTAADARPWLLVAGDFVRTGGMDAANHALASYLARSGRETHLVAHRVDDDLASLPGVVFHRVSRPLGSHLLGFPLLDRAGRKIASQLESRGVRTVVNGGNCRAEGAATWLHYVHAAYAPEIAGRPLRRLVERFSRAKALRDERAVASEAPLVLCNSERTALHAAELLGADAERVQTVYYGSDPERFRVPTEDERTAARAALDLPSGPAVLFVGALGDRRKGFDTLFAAWAELCAGAAWDARLLVVGAGGELAAWKSRAAAAGLAERIRFLGFRSDVPAVMAACDAVVSPTRYEAYGLAVHEAVCRGLVPVVSREAGVAERISPALRPLLVSDPDDAGEVAARLRAWRAEADAFTAAARALSAELRGWTWDRMAARIVDMVEEAG
jgi:glycosyltransferase involved in cell wall biosynthesis